MIPYLTALEHEGMTLAENAQAEPETLDAWEKLAIGFVAAACVFSLRAWWRVG